MSFFVDATVYDGRPADSLNRSLEMKTDRLAKELRAYDLLDELGILYKRVDHEAAHTIESCLDVEAVLGIHICKNLFLCNAQKTKFYLLLMPGNKKFKTKNLSKQIRSARLSFGDDAHMEEFLDITPGSVSVLGLANDTKNRVQLLIDRDVLADEYFGCHPCINTSSLRIRTSDLMDKLLPAIRHEPILVDLPWEEE